MEILEYGNPNAPIVLIQPVDDHDLAVIDNEIAVIRENSMKDFRLAAFKVNNWNKDLSPWKAPAVFGREDFGDGAADTLNEIIRYCEDRTKTYYIGGYSLAGLFALWAAYQTDLFRGVAAASPSMWFPGFTEYLTGCEIKSSHVYLSLGDKEEKTRNRVMSTVGDKIREAYDLLMKQNVDCILEWNKGNHFKDADTRTAKAFLWAIGRQALLTQTEIEVHGTAELSTERLTLRRYCSEDAEPLYRHLGTDSSMYQYSGWNPYATLEMAQETVRRYIAGYDEEHFYSWVMDAHDVLVGIVGAYDYKDDHIEVGYSVVREWQGRGYATEALKKVLEYLTENEGIPCVTAWCAAENVGSWRVLEKAGMQLVHTEKEGLTVGDRKYDKMTYEYRRKS